MNKLLKALLALVLAAGPAAATDTVNTIPQNVLVCPSAGGTACLTNNLSSTITATNVFQQVFASSWNSSVANGNRRGCFIENMGVNTMWLYVGPISGATKAKSMALGGAGQALNPGGTFSCLGPNGIVIADQISITGTIGDNFFAIVY